MTMPPPPKWVPGPFVPSRMPPGIPAQRMPSLRYWQTGQNDTLQGIALRVYGNAREYVRIFNANRLGSVREDRSPGFLVNPDAPVTPGTVLIVP